MNIVEPSYFNYISGGLVQLQNILIGNQAGYKITLIDDEDTFQISTPSSDYYFLHSGNVNIYLHDTDRTLRLDPAMFHTYTHNGGNRVFEIKLNYIR